MVEIDVGQGECVTGRAPGENCTAAVVQAVKAGVGAGAVLQGEVLDGEGLITFQQLVVFDNAIRTVRLLDDGAAGSSAADRDVIAGLDTDLKFTPRKKQSRCRRRC